MLKKYQLLLLTTFLCVSSVAQTASKSTDGSVWVNGRNVENWDTKRWAVGLQTGILGFHGDLTQSTKKRYGGHFSDSKFGLNGGAVVKYSLSHILSLRLSGYAGTFVLQNNGVQYAGNIYDIKNSIKSAELQMYVNLGNVSFLRKERKVNLFIFAGVGTIFNKFSGTLTAVGTTTPYIDFKTDSYWSKKTKSNYATVPLGLGVMYNLNQNFDLGIETGLRYTRTDSLDFANLEIARNRNFDKFSQTTIGIYYKLGSKKAPHYDWINPLTTVYDDVADVKKKVKLLTGDADKDGVADYLDKEAETPEGSRVTGAGESLDLDGDGVPDFKDEEPFSDRGQPVDEKGRMKDDDGDGVPNVRDFELNTPNGNLVNFQGKTIPTADYIDPVTGKRVTTGNTGSGGVGYLPTIYFDTDKWFVKPEFYAELLAVSEIMKQFPNIKLDVVGNADYRLDESHNDMLGNNRAEAVVEVLVKKFGVDRSRLNLKNNGEHLPMVLGKGAAFDPYNRRVNFFVSGGTNAWIK